MNNNKIFPGSFVSEGDVIGRIILSKAQKRKYTTWADAVSGIQKAKVIRINSRQISIVVLEQSEGRWVDQTIIIPIRSEFEIIDGEALKSNKIKEYVLSKKIFNYKKGSKFYLDNDFFIAKDNGLYIINNEENLKYFIPC